MQDVIGKFNPDDYIALLPPSSRDIISNIIAQGVDPINVAARLADIPGEGLAPKGGLQWTKDLFQKIMIEMRILLCTDDPKYAAVRNQLRGESATTARVVLYVVTSAVASVNDMATALCVPLVASILASISKVGLTVWCQAVIPSPIPDSNSQSNSTP